MRPPAAAVALWLALAAPGAAPGAGPSKAEQAIRQLLVVQEKAWNNGDLRTFMTTYEDSPATTFVGSEVTRGYQPVLERYLKRYPTRAAMGTLVFSEIEVHLLSGGHAWAMGRFQLTRKPADGGDAGGRFTLLLRRTATGWKIILDHSS